MRPPRALPSLRRVLPSRIALQHGRGIRLDLRWQGGEALLEVERRVHVTLQRPQRPGMRPLLGPGLADVPALPVLPRILHSPAPPEIGLTGGNVRRDAIV